MASTSSATPIPGATDDENPYEGNPAFSPLQAQVLNEYAKLNRSIKSTTGLIAEINDAKNDALLTELRGLERQMGLVLTLFKASVWSYYRSQGYADDDDDEDEDDLEGSFIRDGQGADESLAQSQHPEEDEGDSTISATDVAPQRNQPTATNAAGYRRPAMKLPLRARDSMAAVRARRGAGFGQGRGAGGRMVDETMETDDGEVTANITAMPLSGAKKR